MIFGGAQDATRLHSRMCARPSAKNVLRTLDLHKPIYVAFAVGLFRAAKIFTVPT